MRRHSFVSPARIGLQCRALLLRCPFSSSTRPSDHSAAPSPVCPASPSAAAADSAPPDVGAVHRRHLLDTFGRFHNYLRVSLIEKCNLRCVYCMPEEGVPLCAASSYLDAGEIVRLVRLFAQNGVDKVRLTGGEPTIRKDLVPIVRDLAALPQIRQLGMTTNGVVLPRMLSSLVEAGLSHLNISLDTLSAEKYVKITRRNALAKAMAGIEAAERILPVGRLKLNCVLTAEKALDIRFIEFMPFSGNRYKMDSFVPYKEMLAQLEEYFGKDRIQRIEDAPNDTSKAYKVKGHRGQFGFISSMSEHFCGSCNRLRLTADGNLKAFVEVFGQEYFPHFRCAFTDWPRRLSTFGADWGSSGTEARQTRGPREAHPNCGFSSGTSHDSNWRMIVGGNGFFPRTPSPPGATLFAVSVRSLRHCSSTFSHLDPAHGNVRMVNVSPKEVSPQRIALARAIVKFPPGVLPALIAHSPKGDFFSVSRIAGIFGAKQTPHLIPLCHQILLSHVKVFFRTDQANDRISVFCRVAATNAQTGVEMEAMVGCSLASLCLYDMAKSASLGIRLEAVELVGKRGGRRDFGRVDAGDEEGEEDGRH
uniref:GTP 3',8-cyclase n=1 Tax=Globodera rostochiensis TaxID=31243 RepID=A0A914HJG4_GLORO